MMSELSTATATHVAPRVSMLGFSIDNMVMDEAIAAILHMTEITCPQQICFVNAHCGNVASRHAVYRQTLRTSHMVFADGIGVKLGCRVLKQRVRDNINGTDLFPLLCAAMAPLGKRLFLLGAHPEVADLVADWVRQHHPGVVIVGTRHGYFSESEQDNVIREVRESRPDVLCVAFGVPRQDVWIRKNLDDLGAKVAMGVGGLFDFYSGRMPRAPLWMRRNGIEWMHRLAQEPRRMWRRYLLGNMTFFLRIFRQRLLGNPR